MWGHGQAVDGREIIAKNRSSLHTDMQMIGLGGRHVPPFFTPLGCSVRHRRVISCEGAHHVKDRASHEVWQQFAFSWHHNLRLAVLGSRSHICHGQQTALTDPQSAANMLDVQFTLS